MPAPTPLDRPTLNAQLLSTGSFHTLSTQIRTLLDESGWTESLAQECRELLRKGEVKTFDELVERVRADAVRRVGEGVRVEGVRVVKEVLGGFVEVEEGR